MDRIVLNGQERDIPAGCTVQAMLEATGNAGRRIAVEINREIVPRSEHALRIVAPGDRVEIVVAMGGG